MEKVINFKANIDYFIKNFSIETLDKMDEDTLLDNLFGCEDEYEETLNTHINKSLITLLNDEFHLIEHENLTLETHLGLTYNSKYANYTDPKNRISFRVEDAKELSIKIRKIINDYNFIITRIKECEFINGKYFESAIKNKDLCLVKYSSSKDLMTFGLRKLLAIYFPDFILPFIKEDDIIEFFYLYDLSYNEDPLKNLIAIHEYCLNKKLTTFELAFNFYNFPKDKKLIINVDEVYDSLESLEKDILNKELKLNKKVVNKNTGKIQYLNSYPIKFRERVDCYLTYSDRVRYKVLLEKISEESDAAIVIKLLNFKRIDELFPTKISNLIEYIQQNFVDDYNEYSKSNKNINDIFEIIKNKRVLKEINIMRGISKCHNLDHKKCEEDIYVLIISENAVKAVKANVYYCSVCRKYSMLHSDFENLTKEYRNSTFGLHVRNLEKFYSGYESKFSLLHMFGYNVNSRKDLISSERRFILDMFVEHFWSRDRLIIHIENEVKKRINIKNKDMNKPISKWKSDIDYLKKRHKQMNDNDINFFFSYFINKGE